MLLTVMKELSAVTSELLKVGKRIVIVDDVTTSGDTIKDVIKVVKDHGGNPVVVTVLIDKSGLEEVDGVPIESLIKVSQLQ